jgi:DNA-directed RNA polymerase subunit RPC12/RpoP
VILQIACPKCGAKNLVVGVGTDHSLCSGCGTKIVVVQGVVQPPVVER